MTKVIYLEQSKASALVGISGIELNCEFVINKKTYLSSITYNIMFHARVTDIYQYDIESFDRCCVH